MNLSVDRGKLGQDGMDREYRHDRGEVREDRSGQQQTTDNAGTRSLLYTAHDLHPPSSRRAQNSSLCCSEHTRKDRELWRSEAALHDFRSASASNTARDARLIRHLSRTCSPPPCPRRAPELVAGARRYRGTSGVHTAAEQLRNI